MKKSTEKIELVETANMALSLRRIYYCPGVTARKIRRAVFNAAQIADCFNDYELSTLRIALKLP